MQGLSGDYTNVHCPKLAPLLKNNPIASVFDLEEFETKFVWLCINFEDETHFLEYDRRYNDFWFSNDERFSVPKIVSKQVFLT